MTTIPTLREIDAEFHRNVTQPSWRRGVSGPGKVTMTGAPKALLDYLVSLAQERERLRADEIAKLRTKADVLRRAGFARRIFRSAHGLSALPPRTPMKPVAWPAWEREHYRVERVVLESRPGYHVTANLYLPKWTAPPWPAVLCVQGHLPGGKHGYQRTAAELASCGFAAFSFDPAGQGERDEYVDVKTGRRTVPLTCPQHAAAGDPAYLLGTTFGEYRLWDCMRSLDYLQSRDDIVGSRLGVTGISGGGWEALWLAATDTRVKAVNSNCYLTTWRRRIERRGDDAEADPEQDPFGVMSARLATATPGRAGLDAADLLVACCPRPVSLGVAIFDFFPVDGALECYAEAKRLYRLAGAADRVGIVVEDCGHELTRGMRKLACEWMLRWLKGVKNPDASDVVDRPWQDERERMTNCMRTGIVLTSIGGKTTAHINAERARTLAVKRARHRPANVAENLRRLLRFEPVKAPLDVTMGKPKRLGPLTVTPMRLRSDGKLRLAAHLWRKPAAAAQPAWIYLAEKDERHDPLKNATCRRLAESGAVVLDLDVRGTGPYAETYNRFTPLVEADLNYDAFLLGRPLAGMRVADVLRALHVLSETDGVSPSQTGIYGEGYGALLALFAACIEPRVARVVERRALTSWSSLVWHREYAWGVNMMLPGALRRLDLADLRAALAPRALTVDEPLDHLKVPLGRRARIEEFAGVRRAYARAGAARAFRLT